MPPSIAGLPTAGIARFGLVAGLPASLFLLVAMTAFAGEKTQAAGNYVLDTDHATLLWKVNHLGFSDYVGRFNSFHASLTFDPEAPGASELVVKIEAASLDVNNPEFAEKLRGEDWFNVDRHPEIRFESTQIERTGATTGRVTGALAFMGVTRPVTLDVELTGQGRNLASGRYTLGFRASGTVRRAEFGLARLPLIVGNDVELEIHAEFVRQ